MQLNLIYKNLKEKYSEVFQKMHILSKEIWHRSNAHTAFFLSPADFWLLQFRQCLATLLPCSDLSLHRYCDILKGVLFHKIVIGDHNYLTFWVIWRTLRKRDTSPCNVVKSYAGFLATEKHREFNLAGNYEKHGEFWGKTPKTQQILSLYSNDGWKF